MRYDSLSLIEDLSQLSTSTSSGVFPQQQVCVRDPVFPVSSGMDRERPYSKEGRISLHWLKFRLLFHLTRWRDVWIPCGDPKESHSSPSLLDTRNHIPLIPREAHGIQGFKRWRCLTLFEMDQIPISLFQLEIEPWSPREAHGVQGFKSWRGLTLLENW